MIPGKYPAKLFKSNVLNNYEQTSTERVGEGFTAQKESYSTTTYDKSTKLTKNVEQLVISTRNKLNFETNDIIEIRNIKWKITNVQKQDDPFVAVNNKIVITLTR